MVPHSATHQRGAIGLMAALTLGLALLFMLLVVDSGRLYLEQRKLQRIADMAALEAAGQNAVCSGTGPQATTIARTAATRNGHDAANPLVASCGYVQTGADQLRTFTVDASRNEAIKVEVDKAVPASVAAGVFALVESGGLSMETTLRASAVASKPQPPQAMLSIKSTLLTLDSRHSALLNALLRALGSDVQLDLASWQGIADTQINVLEYMKQRAIELNANIGNYQEVLSTDAQLSTLLHTAVEVLKQNNATAKVTDDLGRVAATLDIPGLNLGDILAIQNGTASAGLDTSVQLLQLVQSMLLAAASEHALSIDLTSDAPGLINTRLRVKVIEPQQFSAIGDPRVDEIKIHTAQIRALVSLDLPLLNPIIGLINAVADLAAPLTNVLNNVLKLDLRGTITSLTCALGVPCKVSDIKLVPDQLHVDIGLQVGQASSRVLTPPDGFSCAPKRLTTSNQSSAVKLALGKIPEDFLNDENTPVDALRLIDIGTNICTSILGLFPTCGTRVPSVGGGIGVRIDTQILSASHEGTILDFTGASVPDIGLPPVYKAIPNVNDHIVASVSETLQGIHLEAYKPTVSNGLGDILTGAASLLGGVRAILEPILRNLLSPLVDPLVNSLLKVLGIDLVNAEVGANLTCSSGHAQLVM